jgi:ketosteroid isomerase-like protein
MKRVILASQTFVLLAVTAACGPALASPDVARRAVEQTLRDYREAWLAGDETRVMSHVADDFTLFPPGVGSKTVVGKDAIRIFWFPASDTVYRITRYDVSQQQVHVSDGLAVEQGTSLLAWDTVARDSVIGSSTSTNEYLTVLRRDGDSWKLIRSMHVPR